MYDIPICFRLGLCKIILYRIVDKLSNKLLLGMEWLTSVKPTIHWFDYKVGLAFNNSVARLHG